MRTRFRSLPLAFGLIVFFPAATHAATWTVRQDGSGDFTTIVDAVAASADGDSIEIHPGTYNEYVIIDSSLTLYSSAGPDSTILDREGSGRHFRMFGDNICSLAGFTLRNGNTPSSNGGAINLHGGVTLIVDDCVFEDNQTANQGGAIYLGGDDTNLHLYEVSFLRNTAGDRGGAICHARFGEILCNESLFSGNSAVFGGALYNEVPFVPWTIEHSDFEKNTNAIFKFTGDIRSCTFKENEGFVVVNFATNTSSAMYDCILMNNSSNELLVTGGAYYRTLFSRNRMTGSFGRVIGAASLIEHCTLYRNTFDFPSINNAILGSSTLSIGSVDHCIIEGDSTTQTYFQSPQSRSCNLLWNTTDDWDDLGLDEVIDDPLFCDPDSGDFSVSVHSYAAPEHNPCAEVLGVYAPACSLSHGPPLNPTSAACRVDVVSLQGFVQVQEGVTEADVAFRIDNPTAPSETRIYAWEYTTISSNPDLQQMGSGEVVIRAGDFSEVVPLMVNVSSGVSGDDPRVQFVGIGPCGPLFGSDTTETTIAIVEPTFGIFCGDTIFVDPRADTLYATFDLCNQELVGGGGGSLCLEWTARLEDKISGEELGFATGTDTVAEGTCNELTRAIPFSGGVSGELAVLRMTAYTPCGTERYSKKCKFQVKFLTVPCKSGGGSAFIHPDLTGTTLEVAPGADGVILSDLGPANMTGALDTFCLEVVSTGEIGGVYQWTDGTECIAVADSFYHSGSLEATIPVSALPGARDTLYLIDRYCAGGECASYCPPEDIDTLYVEVAVPLTLVCVDTAYAETGVTSVRVPFEVCVPVGGGDTVSVAYAIESASDVGGLTGQFEGVAPLELGDCVRISATLDGSAAVPGDTARVCFMVGLGDSVGAELTDTCYTQLVIVPVAENVPLLSRTAVVALALVLALAAGALLRTR